MTEAYAGKCQCGTLCYELRGQPLTCYLCHCQGCQRGSGSSFTVSLLAQRADLHLTAGELSTSTFEMPSGERTWHGCERCKTSVWYSSPLFQSVVAIEGGTLDAPEGFPPVAHLWTKHAQPHVSLGDLPVFEEQPASLEPLLELWAKR